MLDSTWQWLKSVLQCFMSWKSGLYWIILEGGETFKTWTLVEENKSLEARLLKGIIIVILWPQVIPRKEWACSLKCFGFHSWCLTSLHKPFCNDAIFQVVTQPEGLWNPEDWWSSYWAKQITLHYRVPSLRNLPTENKQRSCLLL